MSSIRTENFTFVDFREMDEAMSRKIWECRNLPNIRKWMINPGHIPYYSHVNFVDSLKSKANIMYYVVLQDGLFVGSINIHIAENGTAERGIYIHPKYWGMGLAKKICRDFYSYIRNNMGINTITTKVLKDNVGSNSLERSLGASKISEDDRFIYYSCNLKDR